MAQFATKLAAATASVAFSLSGAAFADHRNHDDHSTHAAAEHAAVSSGPAKVVDAFAVALASQSEKLVSKLLAQDVLIAEGGGAARTIEEYKAAQMGADMLFMSGVKATLKKRDEIVSGDIAVVVSESELHGHDATTPVHSLMVETMVLKRDKDGTWKIRHIHRSSGDRNG